ncbi:xylose isomerase [Hydrogenovibrio sp. SC-1]|uniref:sugar phosphate isomerase/epimerase family protein n=1 Tax=Hydrogenovibrio sp. SC-1 TaxID=2065820 RepID=UPI000C7A8BC1|nr:sugar phosphate isomerase/epimerase [Hydrogenovibrio sp. SC-1]PLA73610.1 xylose isomerase [Hydrogenovibrio sp. SC-1]
MQLKLFKTLWGHQLSFEQACEQASVANFQGIEGPAPLDRNDQQQWSGMLRWHDLDYIAEIVTGGDYVPQRDWTPEQHLEEFQKRLEASMSLSPLLATCLTGCDAWEESKSVDFYGAALEIAKDYDIPVCFETHRSRPLFNPWTTLRMVEQLPEMKLTADISHWCVVCERLMDSELDTLTQLAPKVHHLHARVGYDQGPQVPHPAAPEYQPALHSHQNFWQTVWQNHLDQQRAFTTMTPEFGPDGYCHLLPFTQAPVADIWQINQWMAETERHHFNQFMTQA